MLMAPGYSVGISYYSGLLLVQRIVKEELQPDALLSSLVHLVRERSSQAADLTYDRLRRA